MPRVGAQPPKGSQALCHVKTCSGKMGKLFAFLDFASNASKCQPSPFNGPFWNSVGYLYDFQVLPPQKRLASTFQPTMKMVIEPAPAILLVEFVWKAGNSTQSPILFWVGGLKLAML